MNAREAILGAITDGAGSALPPDLKPEAVGDVASRFEAELTALGGELVERTRLAELEGSKVFADKDVTLDMLQGMERIDSVWDAEVGITWADMGIADTGSVVISAGPGRQRLASLAPPLHIVLLKRDNLVGTFEEAMNRLGDRTSVVISGPSRTADIEGVLVRGIHGPGRIWVLLVNEP